MAPGPWELSYCGTFLHWLPWGFSQTHHSAATSAGPKGLFFLKKKGGSVPHFRASSANVVTEVLTSLSVTLPQSRCAQEETLTFGRALHPLVLPPPLTPGGPQRVTTRSEIWNRRRGSTEKATELPRQSPVETRHRVFQGIYIYVSNEKQTEHQIHSISFICKNKERIRDMHNFSSLFARQ